VLCEKMMGMDAASCRRMADAAVRTGRVLEIGHQRYYNPVYQASYAGIVKAGLLATCTTRGWCGTATRAGAVPPSCRRPTTARRAGATRPTTT